MKKILTLILLATLFVACSDDDDGKPLYEINQERLVGQWIADLENEYDRPIYFFYKDGTYEDYRIYIGNKVKLRYKGTYKCESDNKFITFKTTYPSVGGGSSQFKMESNDEFFLLGVRYYRDNTQWEIIE